MKKSSILSILCLLLLFSGGCGQSHHYKDVVIDALFSKNQLVLNLPNESSGPRSYFHLKYSLDDAALKDALPEGAQSTQFENGWIIITENDNGTKNHFCLYHFPNQEADWYGYEITQMAVTVETVDSFDLTALLFPIQDLPDLDMLTVDTEYEINVTLQDLSALYQDAGWYNFEMDDSSLRISGYRHQPDWEPGFWEDAFPITLHYREEGDKQFIQVEYGGREPTQEEKYPPGEARPSPTQKPGEASQNSDP